MAKSMDRKQIYPRGAGHEDSTQQVDRTDLAARVRDALGDASYAAYEQLRAELDATIDPGLKDWYAWAATTDRHVSLDRLEDIGALATVIDSGNLRIDDRRVD